MDSVWTFFSFQIHSFLTNMNKSKMCIYSFIEHKFKEIKSVAIVSALSKWPKPWLSLESQRIIPSQLARVVVLLRHSTFCPSAKMLRPLPQCLHDHYRGSSLALWRLLTTQMDFPIYFERKIGGHVESRERVG